MASRWRAFADLMGRMSNLFAESRAKRLASYFDFLGGVALEGEHLRRVEKSASEFDWSGPGAADVWNAACMASRFGAQRRPGWDHSMASRVCSGLRRRWLARPSLAAMEFSSCCEEGRLGDWSYICPDGTRERVRISDRLGKIATEIERKQISGSCQSVPSFGREKGRSGL